jgi:hypothetical protein
MRHIGTPEFPPMSQVFISYRRDDSADAAGRIHDGLVHRFGPDNVVMDVDSIPLGVDFREFLSDAVGRCWVLLAVIGREWLDIRDASGARRLDDPRDFVRVEIEAALQRGIPVIPVLVSGARMPAEDKLPPSLQALAFRNGIAVRRNPDFHRDMERLLNSLNQLLQGPPPPPAKSDPPSTGKAAQVLPPKAEARPQVAPPNPDHRPLSDPAAPKAFTGPPPVPAGTDSDVAPSRPSPKHEEAAEPVVPLSVYQCPHCESLTVASQGSSHREGEKTYLTCSSCKRRFAPSLVAGDQRELENGLPGGNVCNRTFENRLSKWYQCGKCGGIHALKAYAKTARQIDASGGPGHYRDNVLLVCPSCCAMNLLGSQDVWEMSEC